MDDPWSSQRQKLRVKMQTLRVITCSGIPQSSKRGVMNDPKATRNPKLGVIFPKCALMTQCPPLAKPLIAILQLLLQEPVSKLLHSTPRHGKRKQGRATLTYTRCLTAGQWTRNCFTDPFFIKFFHPSPDEPLFPTTKQIISPATIPTVKSLRHCYSRIGAVFALNNMLCSLGGGLVFLAHFFLPTSCFQFFSWQLKKKKKKKTKNWAWHVGYAANVSPHTYVRGFVRQTFFLFLGLNELKLQVRLSMQLLTLSWYKNLNFFEKKSGMRLKLSSVPLMVRWVDIHYFDFSNILILENPDFRTAVKGRKTWRAVAL